jgi:hypothetical protein
MKGFPNQIADLTKLAQGMRCLTDLVDAGEDAGDDGVFGEALVRRGVLRTGHAPIPIERYLREQRAKKKSDQSFRASARGLLELFRLLGLIGTFGEALVVTQDGRQAAEYAGEGLGAEQIAFWRRVIRNLSHHGNDHTASHPYQVMLRLVAQKPGITRAKCALALEAKDDSPEELARIVSLSGLDEEQIRARIGVTESNWNNAKKVFPKFAEQLGDVIKRGDGFWLADAPGEAERETEGGQGPAPQAKRARSVVAEPQPRRPRVSRSVTPETIGTAGIAERDEEPVPPNLDPAAATAANRARFDRLRRHNLLVRQLAARFTEAQMTLYEDPFDILAVLGRVGVLCEIKTLDGSVADERDRVRDALAQLLYYEAFVTGPVAAGASIQKIACFEKPITNEHQAWLNQSRIGTIWKDGNGFAGDALAAGMLGGHLEELR